MSINECRYCGKPVEANRTICQTCVSDSLKEGGMDEVRERSISRFTNENSRLRDELEASTDNVKFWVRLHGIEAEKRGQVEHELDLARGNLTQEFERLERENETLKLGGQHVAIQEKT